MRHYEVWQGGMLIKDELSSLALALKLAYECAKDDADGLAAVYQGSTLTALVEVPDQETGLLAHEAEALELNGGAI